MPPAVPPARDLLACDSGSTLVGYSSLMLLVAIAAITLMYQTDVGGGGDNHRRTIGAISSD
jgi:hypothetical protein